MIAIILTVLAAILITCGVYMGWAGKVKERDKSFFWVIFSLTIVGGIILTSIATANGARLARLEAFRYANYNNQYQIDVCSQTCSIELRGKVENYNEELAIMRYRKANIWTNTLYPEIPEQLEFIIIGTPCNQ